MNAALSDLLRSLPETASRLAEPFNTVWTPVQLGAIVVAALLGWGLSAWIKAHINILPVIARWPAALENAIRVGIANLGIVIFIFILLVLGAVLQRSAPGGQTYLIGVAASLAMAWVVISVVASLIQNTLVKRIVSVAAWSIAALSILSLLEDTMTGLDAVGVTIGGLRVTALLAIKTVALMLITLWLAALLSNFLDMRLRTYSDLTPSLQVLLGKLFRIALITFAVLTVLSSVGIDFSALAIFSGAVGVGIGFGLQKIVSNLVSGIILLADKSIKPGDVITVGDSFGWIGTMGARYTSVVSRDGREYLIPNEDFITQRVVNWTFSNDRVRLDIKFGVSYAADPHAVRKIAIDAAASVPRVITAPGPSCHLVDFGDSAIMFTLRFFIHDPVDGMGSVRSNVMLALWDALKREGIEIPFPQRDLNLRQPMRVVMERDDDSRFEAPTRPAG